MALSPITENLSADYVIDGIGYDSDPLRKEICRRGAKPVIPSRKGMHRRYDRKKYKIRNVERWGIQGKNGWPNLPELPRHSG